MSASEGGRTVTRERPGQDVSAPTGGTGEGRGFLARLRGGGALRGRPQLYTDYGRNQAIFNTPAKRWWFVALLVAAALAPFWLSNQWIQLWGLVFAAAIGAIGMNIITGYAGQISLGHAFFIGIGAYTGIVLSSPATDRLVGFGIDNVLVWLPGAGLGAAILGAIFAPLATRIRGLYLAILTLGLVFLGEHVFREADSLTGGVGTGRRGPSATLFGFDFTASGDVLGVMVNRHQRLYFLAFVSLVVLGLLATNLIRSDTGRSFTAIRDRDIAAEIMGVNLTFGKTLAFAISSFYAGVAGALTATIVGFTEPSGYNLLLSILYIAMILVGGVASIAGSIIGAAFITLLPEIAELIPHYVPFVSPRAIGPWPNILQIERMLYGGLIVVFVIFEPRGLFGLWLRVRNYFKAWPFSY
jgi:branched-chain amino acid transport system permease protein